mmetsp:Transcript_35288/g.81731  ORF Transcript_35288/g.81731 Transcript_35288/m.81731 type:complete len:139 (-) Transcript_35288:119-535(-)
MRITDLSPARIVGKAASHPSTIPESPTITFCGPEERANTVPSETIVHLYSTVATSPNFPGAPVPGLMISLVTPSRRVVEVMDIRDDTRKLGRRKEIGRWSGDGRRTVGVCHAAADDSNTDMVKKGWKFKIECIVDSRR